MEITPKQQRNLYAIFIGLFAVNVAYSIWNVREQAKLREIQQELAEEQLEQAKLQNGK
jgi:hypothetical protein